MQVPRTSASDILNKDSVFTTFIGARCAYQFKDIKYTTSVPRISNRIDADPSRSPNFLRCQVIYSAFDVLQLIRWRKIKGKAKVEQRKISRLNNLCRREFFRQKHAGFQ